MRNLGPEAAQAHARRVASGFYDRFLSGSAALDIGYRGTTSNAEAITAAAIGVELDYPGYDGRRLPFADGSQDAVFVSHVMEHIPDYKNALSDWYRVVRTGGFIIICVPHHYIYERRPALPSLWNPDHKRFYTVPSLLSEIGVALPVNGYRIRHLSENDEGTDPARPPDHAPGQGSYEIEIVLEKIAIAPYTGLLQRAIRMEGHIANMHDEMIDALAACVANELPLATLDGLVARFQTFPPWFKVAAALAKTDADERAVTSLVGQLLRHVSVDEAWYVAMNVDIAVALQQGTLHSAADHWRTQGYFENRAPCW